MKSALFALVLVLLPCSLFAAPADSTATTDPGRPNSLREGAWAAQFSIDGWFNSAGVFFKYHFGDDRAIRFGASFSAATSEGDLSADTLSAPLETGREEQENFSVSLEAIGMKYTNLPASAHFYYGIGPFFGVSSYHSESRVTIIGGPNSGRSQSRSREDDSWRAGAKVVLGAEWFASRALSFNVEWTVLGGYRSISREYTDIDDNPLYPPYHSTGDYDELFVEGGNARFGLSIYF